MTTCFETNILNSRKYKEGKYHSLENDLVKPVKKFSIIFIEITTLGFYSKNTLLVKLMKNHNINIERCYKKMAETAVRASYFIYTCRNKKWITPPLLQFYWLALWAHMWCLNLISECHIVILPFFFLFIKYIVYITF